LPDLISDDGHVGAVDGMLLRFDGLHFMQALASGWHPFSFSD
jgi:hypothetical protein